MTGLKLRRFTVAATAVLAALCLAACGGPTQADVIAQGNAICSKAVAAIRDLNVDQSEFSKAATIVSVETLGLEKLPRPKQNAALLAAFLKAHKQLARAYSALADAEQNHDTAGAARAEAMLAANPASGLARRYGLSRCASAGATVGS